MVWIGFSGKKPVALEVCENSRHRLRRHKRRSSQACVRDSRLLFNYTHYGILCRCEIERPQNFIHPCAQSVLRTLQRIAESLCNRFRNNLT